MDSDMFITFVLHHRGMFIRDEDGELIYANEEIDVWEDVDHDKCCPWLARDLAKQHGYCDFKEVWWHNKQFNLEKGLGLLKKDVDVHDMCLIARKFDYEAHIYFEHQMDVPLFSKIAQSKESLGSIGVGRKTYDEGEGEDTYESDVRMENIQHAAHVEGDRNEDESEASGSNNMSSFDDYESAEDSLYRPSPPLAEESDDGSSEKNEGRDGRSGEETMVANPTLKRSQNFRARVVASKKEKEIPNEAHANSEEEEMYASPEIEARLLTQSTMTR
ncbi:hypothetical protein SESBI_42802 [Sesbania bispinosa]|nr:hypothetical protein SESBI_42802 [Sesbania bispinosa]